MTISMRMGKSSRRYNRDSDESYSKSVKRRRLDEDQKCSYSRRYDDHYEKRSDSGRSSRRYNSHYKSNNNYHSSSSRKYESSRDSKRHRDVKHKAYNSNHSSSNEQENVKNGKSHVEDDDEGHLIYSAGDLLQARYEILSTLGEGTFGKVLLCLDHKKTTITSHTLSNMSDRWPFS